MSTKFPGFTMFLDGSMHSWKSLRQRLDEVSFNAKLFCNFAVSAVFHEDVAIHTSGLQILAWLTVKRIGSIDTHVRAQRRWCGPGKSSFEDVWQFAHLIGSERWICMCQYGWYRAWSMYTPWQFNAERTTWVIKVVESDKGLSSIWAIKTLTAAVYVMLERENDIQDSKRTICNVCMSGLDISCES